MIGEYKGYIAGNDLAHVHQNDFFPPDQDARWNYSHSESGVYRFSVNKDGIEFDNIWPVITVSDDNAIRSTVETEDDNTIIIRLYDLAGNPVDLTGFLFFSFENFGANG